MITSRINKTSVFHQKFQSEIIEATTLKHVFYYVKYSLQKVKVDFYFPSIDLIIMFEKAYQALPISHANKIKSHFHFMLIQDNWNAGDTKLLKEVLSDLTIELLRRKNQS